MQLIGGDTTRGPLAMTLGIHGFVPPGRAMETRWREARRLDLMSPAPRETAPPAWRCCRTG